MSKEKQIEEMARAMCGNGMPDGNCAADDEPCYLECVYGACAERLYAKGYRKQSEGVWKLTTEPLGAHEVDCVECSVCGESWVLDEDFDYDVVKDFWSFCPNCGAKMKGE
jgi:hypothetical protein